MGVKVVLSSIDRPTREDSCAQAYSTGGKVLAAAEKSMSELVVWFYRYNSLIKELIYDSLSFISMLY